MYEMSDEDFERAVDEAIASIPEQFLEALENIAITVQDEPSNEQLATFVWIDADYDEFPDEVGSIEEDCGEPAERESCVGEPLLGLYEGIPITERDSGYGSLGDVPDVITIFKGPHERCFNSRDRIVEEIRKTVIHEIGHYFGIDDERLREMGY